MKSNYISQLISRYFNQRHTAQTESKIQGWLLEKEHSQEKEKALLDAWGGIEAKPNADVYVSLAKVQQKLGMKKPRQLFWNNPIFRAAAILVPFVSIMSVYLLQNRGIEMIEIATLVGEQKEITLPDGSTAWMNACSEISYPENFTEDKREVKLIGEAFFSVVKDSTKAFLVTTTDMTITVLGTEFNVKAYSEDKITSTTLMSGKVEVRLENRNYTLKPSQELIYDRTEKSSTLQEVSDNSTQWKEGILVFSEMTFVEILTSLERQYNIEFQYHPSDYSEDNYSIKFPSQDSLEYIMEVMQDVVGGFSYDINNTKITLIKQ